MKTGPKPKPLEELFWSKVRKGSSCWEWTACISHGRGILVHVVNRKQKMWLAHRLAWTLLRGPIPKGMFVCHHCDNPKCVNPGHLFIGTHQMNVTDSVRKWRHTYGEKNPQAKLTEKQVKKIRMLRKQGWTYDRLASKFHMTLSPIRDVCKGYTWQFVT